MAFIRCESSVSFLGRKDSFRVDTCVGGVTWHDLEGVGDDG
jgi:hypothetical protein